jgi:D-alanyl-lipoteichoic acid acyltransferase DltB (MBOAT superfamily)
MDESEKHFYNLPGKWFLAWRQLDLYCVGGLNALYFMPLLLLDKNRANLQIVAQGKMFPSIAELTSIAVTFGLTVLAWIFFRAESVSQAVRYIGKYFQLPFSKYQTKKLFLAVILTLQ